MIAQADHFRATGDRGVPRPELGLDREGLALHRRHRHRRQRPRREHEVRPRLGGGRRALPAARGDLPAGGLDRGLPRAWPRWPTLGETTALADEARAARSGHARRWRRRTGLRIEASTPSPPRSRATRPPRRSPGPSARGARRASRPSRKGGLVRRGHGPARRPAVVGLARRRARAVARSTTSAPAPWPRTGAQRLLSDRSELYDPLSYHYGSVWPLFTGWASMAAYRYGRPHVGYQALDGERAAPDRAAPSAT